MNKLFVLILIVFMISCKEEDVEKVEVFVVTLADVGLYCRATITFQEDDMERIKRITGKDGLSYATDGLVIGEFDNDSNDFISVQVGEELMVTVTKADDTWICSGAMTPHPFVKVIKTEFIK